jgi:hypothetical protein
MAEADYWTSDEGYTYLQDCVRRVIGDVPYRDRVLTLIPSRAKLRARFNLEFYRLSVRLEMKEEIRRKTTGDFNIHNYKVMFKIKEEFKGFFCFDYYEEEYEHSSLK